MKRLTIPPLAPILALYLMLASLYSVITPLWEASDEQWHYPMVKTLADNALQLPVQVPGQTTAWRQEGSQPPLYYLLGALLTSWIDTADLDQARRINPYADIGVILPDGNFNMALHDPAVEGFPWRGAALAAHLVRLFSVVLGAVTVFMTYRLAQAVFPERRGLWGASAALVAFNPMFLFISGSVNNDNLSTMLATALLVQIVGVLRRDSAPPLGVLVSLGGCAGAGMIAKFNIGFMLLLIALALGVCALRLRAWRILLIGGLVTGGLTILIGGWWYVRNWQLYGDPTGLNVFLDIVGRRTIPASWAQLWSERHTFLMSYWGFFGGVNLPLPDAMYSLFNALAALGVVGLGIGLVRAVRPFTFSADEEDAEEDAPPTRPLLMARALTVLWIVISFGGLLRWTTETWASQGRLMFAAIAPISLWLALGLFQFRHLIPILGRHILGVAWAWHLLAAVFGVGLIWVAYRDPFLLVQPPILAHEPTLRGRGIPEPTLVRFCEPDAPDRCLSASYYGVVDAQVGTYVQFTATLGTAGALSRDWTAFVHVVSQDGLIVAQRDVYPGQGQIATSRLAGNSLWRNRFAVFIPDGTLAPQPARVLLGFYDQHTGQRMQLVGEPTGDTALIGEIQLLPRTTTLGVPTPLSVNFGGEAELVGYALSAQVAQPGETLRITLYWRGQRPMQTDYRVFVQILQPNTTNVFASSDAMPAAWTRPTTSWQVGEVIADEHQIAIPAAAPAGTWQIAVGMYQLVEQPDGNPPGNQFRRLRVVTADGGDANDYFYLSRVKFVPRP